MKIKSVNNLNAGNVLTEQELKSIIGGTSYKCWCFPKNGMVSFGHYIPSGPGDCSVTGCISHHVCSTSYDCRAELEGGASNIGSGSGFGSGSGSGSGSDFGSDFGSF